MHSLKRLRPWLPAQAPPSGKSPLFFVVLLAAGVSSEAEFQKPAGLTESVQREKGYISQPSPRATTRNAKNAQRA